MWWKRGCLKKELSWNSYINGWCHNKIIFCSTGWLTLQVPRDLSLVLNSFSWLYSSFETFKKSLYFLFPYFFHWSKMHIKLTILTILLYSSVTLSIFARSYNCHNYLHSSSCKTESLYPLNNNSIFPLPTALVNTIQFSVSIVLTIPVNRSCCIYLFVTSYLT
jgi:hypothetical protein